MAQPGPLSGITIVDLSRILDSGVSALAIIAIAFIANRRREKFESWTLMQGSLISQFP
jgi:hypothetical protein